MVVTSQTTTRGKSGGNYIKWEGNEVSIGNGTHHSFMISSFGLFAARLWWARQILDRFRDADTAAVTVTALCREDACIAPREGE
jgi:hypothetical protein